MTAETMFTKESIVTYIENEAVRPLSEEELAEALGAESVEQLVQLKTFLKELEDEGVLVLSRKNRYGLPEQFNLLKGKISRHPKGFGFLISENPELEDLYIHASDLNGALNGDKVIARIKRPAGFDARTGTKFRAEGEVIRILARNVQHIVGTFESSKHFAFVIPDDKKFGSDIFISKDNFNGARNGMKVLVEIITWPQKTRSAEGKVVQLIGYKDSPGVDILSIIYGHSLPQEFPAEVLEAARVIPEDLDAGEVEKRRDLRDLLMITIDGEDAKDLDDAVTVQKLENGNYLLGVHIADVSHYVTPHSPIDKEAFDRATSVYLVDRTIPMLPEKLCNMVCSLRPNEDKLTYSVLFEMNDKAEVVNYRITKAIICSNRRFTYEEAQTIIETGQGEFCEELLAMNALAVQLRANRFKAGAISFERSEVRFNIDEQGKPLSVYFKEAKEANKLVEEFMLLANRTVAEHIGKVKKGDRAKTFVYRIHDEPNQEKLANFSQFISRFGYKLKTSGKKNEISSAINRLLYNVAGKREQNLVETLAVRSMAKAIYTTDNIGHYGLAFDYYTHFTSPIRRYPDVLVHRLLFSYLQGANSVKEETYEKMCQHCSDREQVAASAERASIKYKQVEFMSDKKGQVFDGVISGVTEWGLYVEITSNKCEGMVPLRDMDDDFYTYDEKNYCIIGRQSRKKYQLGDEVQIMVQRANLEKKQLDFVLV